MLTHPREVGSDYESWAPIYLRDRRLRAGFTYSTSRVDAKAYEYVDRPSKGSHRE